jgi:transcriptional regulator with XRE-family HTH domain
LNRSNPEAFQASVYLLRRAVNLPLKEVAALAGVSPPRISQIQSKLESETPDPRLRRLMRLYQL